MPESEYMTRDSIFIGGKWMPPSSDETITAICASTEEPFGSVPRALEADVDEAVRAARSAFDEGPWRWLSPTERADYLLRLADALESRAQTVGYLTSLENGTPSAGSIFQGMAPVMMFRATAGLAETFAFTERRQGVMTEADIVHEPVGVVGAIVPWNVPLALTASKVAPALLAGCTVVVKASPEAPLDMYQFADACAEVGFPDGAINIMVGDRDAGAALVEHPGVDKIAFTGSTATGRSIMAKCAELLKRVSLELGGKSAALLLDDVDLPTQIPAMLPIMTGNGQACIFQSRVLAPRSRYNEVVEALSEAIGALPVGDALDLATRVGPLASSRQRERVEGYIAIGKEEGGRVALGGGRPAHLSKGWFVEPTIFADVDNSYRIAQEEIFGPVVCVIPYDSEPDGVRLANASPYGLGGSVYSSDPDRARNAARRIRTGTIGVNGWWIDVGLPFGGFKQSGIGREHGVEGLQQYLETKVIFGA